MKVAKDDLIAALLHPRLYLCGDEDGGVGLHCRDHFDDGRPLAYLSALAAHADVKVVTVTSVAALIGEAAKHLQSTHREP
ncbi:hypothetical protein [Nonomuraea wenchangensis]|uniref:Uncharacterized protein n=1 Tax=Nonomuraea wenchangensis TaxID=568860 RepID=A0A1I0ET50_9ACTN|nr:hypothetical protein [Nonomuraea wenchangensis]SET48731.1 hypothetical protein SAMN05421811_103195 [Nonomuraea wenchangensis]